ncbi:hypothetical protein JCM33374_g5079 [Metschnikowia sp. JCM 33374]|nr:hypothetical protein JCM33374_g5079 [Metschnikowia sp. JCM 33374]
MGIIISTMSAPKKCKCRKRPYHFPDNCPVKARPIAHRTWGDLMPKIQQKTTNQNVNATKAKDNSSTRKNHNMYEAFNNEDESEDAMNFGRGCPSGTSSGGTSHKSTYGH